MAEPNENLTWRTATLGDIGGDTKKFFEDLENAIAVNTAALKAAQVKYQAAKAFALVAANPATALISQFVTEIDNYLKDIEQAGIYYLTVNSVFSGGYIQSAKTVYGNLVAQQEKEVLAYWSRNGDLVGSINGQTVPSIPPYGADPASTDTYTVTPSVASRAIVGNQVGQARDVFDSTLTKLVPTYNQDSASGQPTINSTTGLPEMTPGSVIQSMVSAFSDRGDLRKQFLDDDGNPTTEQRAAIDPIIPTQKRFRYVDNKPTFTSTSTVGGQVLIFGSTNLNGFTKLLSQLKNLFKLSEFDGTADEYAKLLAPPTIEVTVQDVTRLKKDNNGQDVFEEENFAQRLKKIEEDESDEKIVLVEIVGVKDKQKLTGAEFEIIKAQQTKKPKILMENDLGQQIDVNGSPVVYYEEKLTLQPLNYFQREPRPGNILAEATERIIKKSLEVDDESKLTVGEAKSGGKLNKAKDLDVETNSSTVEEVDNSEKEWVQKIPTEETSVHVCRVKYRQKKPKSTPPDFRSLTIGGLFPTLSTGIGLARGGLSSFKALLSRPAALIELTIKKIDEQIKKLEDINKTMIAIQAEILKLRDIGFYSLTIEPEEGGTQKFIDNLSNAPNPPPETLKFSAGLLIVAGSPDNKSKERIIDTHNLIKELFKQAT